MFVHQINVSLTVCDNFLPPVNTYTATCLSPHPGCDWVLLSPCYVQTDDDVTGWRELFSRLGVRDGLIIRKERRTLTAKELVRRTLLNCGFSYLAVTFNSCCKDATILAQKDQTKVVTAVPVSTEDKGLWMCCVKAQYLLVAWTPEAKLNLPLC